MVHSYPHCWRTNDPIIFRATEQWFISMEKNALRKNALRSINEVTWIPPWGRDRIYGMIENRPDWCVSRQRAWGIPITVFYCSTCQKPMVTQETIGHVVGLFRGGERMSGLRKRPIVFCRKGLSVVDPEGESLEGNGYPRCLVRFRGLLCSRPGETRESSDSGEPLSLRECRHRRMVPQFSA